MACEDTNKAIVNIASPVSDRIVFGSPPIEVEVFERSPLWQLQYYYEYPGRFDWVAFTNSVEAWGEEGEVGLRFEELPSVVRIWLKGRFPNPDSLLGPVVEVIAEEYDPESRPIRNFQVLGKNIASPRAWKFVISDISGPVIERFYEQMPEWEVVCGCKSSECEIPCTSKSEGFCCLSKSRLLAMQRKLFDTEGGYYLR